jgi:chromosome partitioning protein
MFPAMILTVAAYKGGVGKTSTAIHLAAYLAGQGPTILIDGDPNRSASGWAERGGEGALPFKVVPVAQLPKVARQFEHIVIDTEARPATEDLKELVEGGDFLVVPTTPDAMSLEATEQTVVQLRKNGAEGRFAVLLTIVPPSPSRVGQEAAAYLTDSGIPLLNTHVRRFMAHQNAAALGVAVSAIKDANAGRAWDDYRRAAAEIVALVTP